jgi:hypothetical protein
VSQGALVVIPCLPVGRAELAEARRALAGQGRGGLADEAVARLLWTARAIPAVVEIMVEAGAGALEFAGLDVDRAPTTSRGPLSLVAWRRDDELVIEVLVLRDDDLAQRAFDNAVCRLMVGLRRPLIRPQAAGDDNDITAEDNVIRLQRFSFGARGKTS